MLYSLISFFSVLFPLSLIRADPGPWCVCAERLFLKEDQLQFLAPRRKVLFNMKTPFFFFLFTDVIVRVSP